LLLQLECGPNEVERVGTRAADACFLQRVHSLFRDHFANWRQPWRSWRTNGCRSYEKSSARAKEHLVNWQMVMRLHGWPGLIEAASGHGGLLSTTLLEATRFFETASIVPCGEAQGI
jgi:hypothetical protein